MKTVLPWLKTPFLLPAAWAMRIWNVVTKRKENIRLLFHNAEAYRHIEASEKDKRRRFFERWGLGEYTISWNDNPYLYCELNIFNKLISYPLQAQPSARRVSLLKRKITKKAGSARLKTSYAHSNKYFQIVNQFIKKMNYFVKIDKKF